MKRARQRSKPTFLWQGVLISVPMLLLAAIGVYALHKDRLLAMENARQRARETLAPLALTMGHRFETELTRWNTLAPGSLGPLETGNVSSPSNAPGLEWWTRALTNAPKGPLPAVLIFSEGGALHWPKPYARPPEPAPWHAELTQTQRLLWDHICSMENTSDVIPLLERFLALQPSSQARLNADWVRLRSEIPTRTMDQAGTQLLEFADRTRQAQTESGLPLSTLVLLDLVRQCSRSGLNERAWIRLSEEVIDRPSMLMPFLLDAVDAASGGRELSDEARALRAVWEFQEAQRKVANLVRESGVLRAALATNFWMGTPRNWMLSRPIQTVSRTTQDGRMLAFTNTVIQVFVYPKDLVEKALEPALAQAGHLPSYSTLAVELAGERLGSNTQTGIFTNEVLAGTG
ncbi:MAG TPA: hypothetical protein VN673_06115, partial [Clostridia bacterium]|nr:hypothetical protein [Clostridia bacterium]